MAPKGNTALYRDKKKNAVSKKIKSAMKRLHESSNCQSLNKIERFWNSSSLKNQKKNPKSLSCWKIEISKKFAKVRLSGVRLTGIQLYTVYWVY